MKTLSMYVNIHYLGVCFKNGSKGVFVTLLKLTGRGDLDRQLYFMFRLQTDHHQGRLISPMSIAESKSHREYETKTSNFIMQASIG